MKKIKSLLYTIAFFLLGYPLGVSLTSLIFLLRITNIIHVKGMENCRKALKMKKELNLALLIPGNHPHGIETFLVPGIACFPKLVWNPNKYFPWCTPKSTLFYFVPFIYLLRAIPVYRGSVSKNRIFMKQLAKILHEDKQIVMYFVEGGRTCSKREDAIKRNGKEMRPVKSGYWEVMNNKNFHPSASPENVLLLPTWTEVKGRSVTITFGEPRKGSETPREKLEEILFEL
jgi:1-acyl-sn-glycerol-3-phosphate acyltransferase